MKDLVYIIPDKDGGVTSVVRNLLIFKSSGYKTKVILIHNILDDAKRRCNETSFNADEIVKIAYDPKINSNYSVLQTISKHLNHNSVLIANDGNFDLNVLRYTKIKLPTVYIMHGDLMHYYSAIRGKSNLMGLIITVSDYLKQEVKSVLKKSTFDISNLKVETIKFPVPKSNVNFVNKSYSDHIRLVFVGTLIEAKGVSQLKVIIDDLEKLEVKYTLNIIGSGIEEPSLKQEFRDNSNVYFLGQLSNPEVIELHINHDILLLPSKSEGLPVVVVEAMKCGVIPMSTNLKSGIPELIENSVNGFTVDINQPHKYAEYICKLYKDRDGMKMMAQLNIDKANAMFDPIVQTQAYERAFNEAKIVSFKESLLKRLLSRLPMNMEYNIIKRISS